MKKASKTSTAATGTRREYDFSKGVRGKYAARHAAGIHVVTLKPSVSAAFPTSKAVNDALEGLLRLTKPLRKAAV